MIFNLVNIHLLIYNYILHGISRMFKPAYNAPLAMDQVGLSSRHQALWWVGSVERGLKEEVRGHSLN